MKQVEIGTEHTVTRVEVRVSARVFSSVTHKKQNNYSMLVPAKSAVTDHVYFVFRGLLQLPLWYGLWFIVEGRNGTCRCLNITVI